MIPKSSSTPAKLSQWAFPHGFQILHYVTSMNIPNFSLDYMKLSFQDLTLESLSKFPMASKYSTFCAVLSPSFPVPTFIDFYTPGSVQKTSARVSLRGNQQLA